jgi:hypothetical protein
MVGRDAQLAAGLQLVGEQPTGPSLTIRRLAWRALGQGSGWSR